MSISPVPTPALYTERAKKVMRDDPDAHRSAVLALDPGKCFQFDAFARADALAILHHVAGGS